MLLTSPIDEASLRSSIGRLGTDCSQKIEHPLDDGLRLLDLLGVHRSPPRKLCQWEVPGPHERLIGLSLNRACYRTTSEEATKNSRFSAPFGHECDTTPSGGLRWTVRTCDGARG